MEKKDIIEKINLKLKLKCENFLITESEMDKLAIDISRVMDSVYTDYINIIKKKYGLKINSIQKELFRKYFIGYPVDSSEINIFVDEIPTVSDENLKKAYDFILEGFDRKESVMINSIIARIEKNILLDKKHDYLDYIEYVKSIEKDKSQMLIISVKSEDCYTENNISEIILNKYNNLSNYHYAAIVFEDDNISWDIISKVAIFMEHMHVEYGFNVFNHRNKDRRINELISFLNNNQNIQGDFSLNNVIENFYNGVSYGFQFEDLYIADDGKMKILVMQKVQLDEKPKKCPSCFEEKIRGNSYPKILYRSFECQNENCPSRSKIGRGKRFDLFSAKRQSMLDRHDKNDYISDDVYSLFRKDIFENDKFNIGNLIDLYSWKDDTIEIVNLSSNEIKNEYRGRKIIYSYYKEFRFESLFENLPIVRLMNEIRDRINIKAIDSTYSYKKIMGNFVINADSTSGLMNLNDLLEDNTIGGAVTSPPYYNAREYSQWSNFICYLIDMMINAKSIYHSLNDYGKYLYNIGDIVGQDNVYINSNMSKRRLMLGFYSLFIFSIVGYKCLGNIIWNKGEVQSKRNSNSNHFPGYLKPVNVYEHCLLFSKNNEEKYIRTEIKRIDPVKKINSKGENILGHTAPYPKELSKLIIPFIDRDCFILDPYLGSGTTVMAMIDEGIKSIGFEIDEKYYDLCVERIKFNK
ncbi:DNA methyltransferase [Histophilus somni]|uniref:DNA methyltransferase n=1 Tax=Histophilus somni TaxID=731 RepID=UPI00201EE7D8|nr:DNA methyltransferase [Histophilus somni]